LVLIVLKKINISKKRKEMKWLDKINEIVIFILDHMENSEWGYF